jgi:hypothetical protein
MPNDTTPEPSRDELQKAYEAIYLAQHRQEIDLDERNARTTALMNSPLGVGLSRQDHDAISSAAAHRVIDIIDGLEPAPLGTIDFRAAQRSRDFAKTDAEIDADEAQWEDFQSTLINLLITSPVYAIESATIGALLEVMLERDNIELMDAIETLEQHIRIIRDVEQRRLNLIARGIIKLERE